MVAMNSQKTHSRKILSALKKLAPKASFEEHDSFYWSPETQVVAFKAADLEYDEGIWCLLHETAHAQLAHTNYETDFALLTLEVAAWEEAKILGKQLDITIDNEHIQDCLDTYRDWLHRRSTCPACGTVGLQQSPTNYRCHNCNDEWSVTSERFCRPYRRKAVSVVEKQLDISKNHPTFH